MADVNLVEDTQESNGFKSCTEIEDECVHIQAQLRVLMDLLSIHRYDFGNDNDDAITLTVSGAWGLSNTLWDCSRFMRKATDLAAAGFKKRKNQKKTQPGAPTREEQATATPDKVSEQSQKHKNNLDSCFLSSIAYNLDNAISILELIEEHHFNKADNPLPLEDEFERLGTLIKHVNSEMILTRKEVEQMIEA